MNKTKTSLCAGMALFLCAFGTVYAAPADATLGDGLFFHRVISKANGDNQDFMIQTGDLPGNGTGVPGYRFPDEIIPLPMFSKRWGSSRVMA
jgi:cyclophilin family peptidyl-prolyl cis-trans isomerase